MKRSRLSTRVLLGAAALSTMFAATALVAPKTLISLRGVQATPAQPSKKFSAWSAPTNLGATINTEFEELLPHQSKDGLSLYFASNRPGGFGDFDIWVSERAARNDEWGPPMNLGSIINTSFNDRAPGLSRDGHTLFFATTRPGGLGNLDIWASHRDHTHDNFGWEPPVHLGTGLNSTANDFGPNYLANDDSGIPSLTMGSNRAGSFDIYVSELQPDGSWGPATMIAELSTSFNELRPTVRPDGIEMFFDSDRPGGTGMRDVWTSRRDSIFSPWSAPEPLGPAINTSAQDGFPSLSSDGRSLIFTSNRPGGPGGSDLYLSTRDKGK